LEGFYTFDDLLKSLSAVICQRTEHLGVEFKNITEEYQGSVDVIALIIDDKDLKEMVGVVFCAFKKSL